MKMDLKYRTPAEIEERSFALIEAELEEELPPLYAPVIKRVIHTTADFDYAENLYFSPGVIEKALETLRAGATIVTDTTMALSGINKPALQMLGGNVVCYIGSEEAAEAARREGCTRSAAAVDLAAKLTGPVIFAVGNAPTALLRLRERIDEGMISPALVIAAPVGFVNVTEAKEAIMESGVPNITARGRKGGSNVAAAIINALMYMITRS